MKITIDATPQEFAEFIFELVDCDVEIQDGDTEDDTTSADKFIIKLLSVIQDFKDSQAT